MLAYDAKLQIWIGKKTPVPMLQNELIV